MKKFIVITTINPPTEAILKFLNFKDWTTIIVGDLKTPHEQYRQFNDEGRCIYLDPNIQEEKYESFSDLLGWNLSARRNIGFIEAYNRGADILALVDDDNIPYKSWGKDVFVGTKVKTECYTSNKINVFDPLSVTNNNTYWHRGFPLEYVKHRQYISIGEVDMIPLVQANLWNGNPDIDAVERLLYNHELFFTSKYFTTNLKYTPFNSQNTFLSRQVIPYFMLLPNIGRVDDIWGAYLMEQQVNISDPIILYGPPTVYQKRNNHNLYQDLNQELYGVSNVLRFLDDITTLPEATKKLYLEYQRQFK